MVDKRRGAQRCRSAGCCIPFQRHNTIWLAGLSSHRANAINIAPVFCSRPCTNGDGNAAGCFSWRTGSTKRRGWGRDRESWGGRTCGRSLVAAATTSRRVRDGAYRGGGDSKRFRREAAATAGGNDDRSRRRSFESTRVESASFDNVCQYGASRLTYRAVSIETMRHR